MPENEPRERLTREQQLETLYKVLDDGLVSDYSAAIDGGANRGDWTQVMARSFSVVHAFEPAPDTVETLRANLAGIENVVIHEKALFNRRGRGVVKHPPKRTSSSARYVHPRENGSVVLTTIDALRLPHCGLIKVDLEGAEFEALQGALKTIGRCRPILMVEINRFSRKHFGRSPNQVRQLIKTLDYELVFSRGDDFVFKPRRRA